LNADYAIAGRLEFLAGRGGFPVAGINNGRARALVSVYAGQVLSFQPRGQANDLLFVSDAAYYTAGKAIKGGIPICWPWFGPDPEGGGRSAHGFVRNRMWAVRASESLADGDIRLTLGLAADAETRVIWPYAFDLALTVTVGDGLQLALVTRNTGDRDILLSQALHSYFNVGDIGQVQIDGLDGSEYLDKVGVGGRCGQTGAVGFEQEVDRIYLDVPPKLVIDDAAFGRRIDIQSTGSRTAVVWNPWADIAASMGDLGNQDYRRFVCVETANAADNSVMLAPGGEHRLGAAYRILT